MTQSLSCWKTKICNHCVVFCVVTGSYYVGFALYFLMGGTRDRFNIKMTSYQYRESHCGDKTILRPSYLHNEISYTGKMTSLYWIRALEFCSLFLKWCPYSTMWVGHFNSLWPRDAIWRHSSGSTLVQVMTCCLTTPTNYLNQILCWHIIGPLGIHLKTLS